MQRSTNPFDRPIITTLLDTDLYKFTMQQAMRRFYPLASAKMTFCCRTGTLNLHLPEVREQINALADLRLSSDELAWLDQQTCFSREFVHWLSTFRLNPDAVTLSESNDGIDIQVTGNWVAITHFEIYILAIVSELHCRNAFSQNARSEGLRRLDNKIQQLKQALGHGEGFSLFDFGTRRRYSADWQATVVSTLSQSLPGVFAGTSNLHLARTQGLKPVGTMAHEWLQAHQALGDDLSSFQREALLVWLDFYQGQLSIALTDTIGMDAFLKDFDRDLATAFQGIRQDSGDPFHWGELALEHYKNLGIDPRDKQFVFSDKLDFDTAVQLYRRFHQRVNVSFGIGTYLTNDMGDSAPDIVLKLVELNQKPVAKLSDSPGKILCDDDAYIARLRALFAR